MDSRGKSAAPGHGRQGLHLNHSGQGPMYFTDMYTSMLGVPQQRICMITENLVFPVWHLVPNPSVLSVEMPFCLTFKGQFLPGIELFSATKYVGPVLDLHWVCLHCSTWEPSQGQRVDAGMAWVFLGRKTGFAGTKGDMENSNHPVICPQRTLLRTLYKHRPKRTLYRHGSYCSAQFGRQGTWHKSE